jgi:hypothetical protein
VSFHDETSLPNVAEDDVVVVPSHSHGEIDVTGATLST